MRKRRIGFGLLLSIFLAVMSVKTIYAAEEMYKVYCYLYDTDKNPIKTAEYSINEGYFMDIYSYTEDTENLSFETPVLDNYEFLGWSVSGSLDYEKEIVIPKGSTGNKYYIARWQGKLVNVFFDSQGGSVVDDMQSRYTNRLGKLPTPTREGYDFDGWYTKDVGGTEVTSSSETPADDVTYYARWIPKQFYIYCYDFKEEYAGGQIIGGQETINYTIESDDIELEIPKRKGYIFTGWIGTGLTKPVMKLIIPKGSIGNKEYVGTWKSDPCATEHDYYDVITKATLEKDGVKIATCKNCGQTKSSIKISRINKVILSATSYICDGKEKKPKVTISSFDGNILEKDRDYIVTYKNNIQSGTGIVKIVFKGNYEGTLEKTFKIVQGKLTLNYKKLNLKLTDQKKLKCTKSPSNIFSSKVYWKSSNTQVAKVSSNGKVVAKGFGQCTITAYTKEGIEAKCKVTIKESDLYLFKNHTFKLAKINGKKYKWHTKNKSIAIAGKTATGISQGKTTIYRRVNGTTYKYNVYITDYKKLANAAIKKEGKGELSSIGYYVTYDDAGDEQPIELQPPVVCLVYTSWSLLGGYDYDYEYFKYDKKFRVRRVCYEDELNDCDHSIRCYQYKNFGKRKSKQKW